MNLLGHEMLNANSAKVATGDETEKTAVGKTNPDNN